MPTLTELHFQRLLDHAQQTLLDHEHYYQDRDPHYREVLALVEDLSELLLEVRRDRAALEEIVRIWGDFEAHTTGGASPDVHAHAVRMANAARHALGLPERKVTGDEPVTVVETVQLRVVAAAEPIPHALLPDP